MSTQLYDNSGTIVHQSSVKHASSVAIFPLKKEKAPARLFSVGAQMAVVWRPREDGEETILRICSSAVFACHFTKQCMCQLTTKTKKPLKNLHLEKHPQRKPYPPVIISVLKRGQVHHPLATPPVTRASGIIRRFGLVYLNQEAP